jgi:hypothetical protein
MRAAVGGAISRFGCTAFAGGEKHPGGLLKNPSHMLPYGSVALLPGGLAVYRCADG